MVNDRDDVIALIYGLVDDLEANPKDWENATLKNYLEAMARWIGDMDGFYKNNQIELPKHIPWRIFTDILMAAKVYE